MNEWFQRKAPKNFIVFDDLVNGRDLTHFHPPPCVSNFRILFRKLNSERHVHFTEFSKEEVPSDLLLLAVIAGIIHLSGEYWELIDIPFENIGVSEVTILRECLLKAPEGRSIHDIRRELGRIDSHRLERQLWMFFTAGMVAVEETKESPPRFLWISDRFGSGRPR